MKRLARLLLTLLSLSILPTSLWAVTVTRTPGTCANVMGIGTDNWSNPGNATTQNGVSATVALGNSESSRYLRCSNYGFTLPSNAIVDGITVTVRRSADSATGSPRDSEVRLLKGGTLQTVNNYASGSTYPTAALGDASYGGNSDLWSNSWTAAEINNTGFGVSFVSQRGTGGGTRTISVDVISVAIDYTIDNTPPTVSAIVRTSANPTVGNTSLSWTVTFSESVTGVDASDFALVQGGGVSGASITSVTGSGASWTVTAYPGVNTGTLGLNLVDDDSIQDSVANRLGGTGTGNGNFSGEVYTVTAAPCNAPTNIPAGVSVTCVCDNFNRANLSPSTIFGQDWIPSKSDSTTIVPSIANSSVLRLTDNTTGNAKAATLPAAFPAAGNYISVEFNHYAYGGGTGGGDGMAVILSDYTVAAAPGAFGGSLGYAQKSNPGSDCTTAGGCPGFAGGWVGVALDEYGNYASASEGRQGGSGFQANAVGIRGSGNGTTGYPWLGGTGLLTPNIDTGTTSTTPGFGYRYQIVLDARNAGASPAQTFITVNRDTGTGYGNLIGPLNAYTANASQAAVPANWQLSFTGSTGGSTNIHEIDNLRVCATTIVPPSGGVASGFAVIDEAYGTPALAVQNYQSGRIYTKLSGTPFKLNVAVINNNQIQTGYVLGSATKNVNVRLVDNSDGICVLNSSQTNYCSAACQAKATSATATVASQSMTFTSSNAGQQQSTDFTISGAWSNLVALVSDGTNVNANGVWACSIDAFTVRPLALTTPSTTVATNSALTGTPALRAGNDPFNLIVGTTTSGYAGAAATPTINAAGVQANQSTWAAGSIAGSFPSVPIQTPATTQTTGTFTYSEAGHFLFLGYDPTTAADYTKVRGIHDSTWTAVDQSTTDCIAGSYANTRNTTGNYTTNPATYGKYGCLFGLTTNSGLFGRFIPDHFTLTTSSVTPACPSTSVNSVINRPHTYMGQARLGLAYRLEARNAAEGVTQNYSAARMPGVTPTLVAEDQTITGCDLGPRLGNAPSTSWTLGVYNASSSTTVFSRPSAGTPGSLNASTPALCTNTYPTAGNPFWALDIGVQVLDNNATMGAADMNAGTTGTCSGATCNASRIGTTGIVLGRLNLLNAYGSDALPLLVPVRAEYWNGTSWQLNTDDRCTTLSASNLAVGNVTPANGSSLNVTSGSLSMTAAATATATMSNGVTSFRINPATKGAGSVDLVLNLGFGTANANWCGAWGTGPAAGTGTLPNPDLSFLAGNWCGSNADRDPAARVRFGSPRVPFIYLRERY